MRGPQAKDTVIDLNFFRDWLAKRARARAKEGKKKPAYFVTISREFGCVGYEFAETLTEKLSEATGTPWSLFTRSMIEEMAAMENLGPEMVHEVSEKRWTFKDWFVDALVPDYLQSHSSRVFEKMKTFILNLANNGNCVILGAGSQIITQRLDPKKFYGVHVRIVASREWRLRRIEELYKLGRDDAEKMLRERQDSRDRFIRDFTGRNAADPALYHIIFNNARNAPETMASMLVVYLRDIGAMD